MSYPNCQSQAIVYQQHYYHCDPRNVPQYSCRDYAFPDNGYIANQIPSIHTEKLMLCRDPGGEIFANQASPGMAPYVTPMVAHLQHLWKSSDIDMPRCKQELETTQLPRDCVSEYMPPRNSFAECDALAQPRPRLGYVGDIAESMAKLQPTGQWLPNNPIMPNYGSTSANLDADVDMEPPSVPCAPRSWSIQAGDAKKIREVVRERINSIQRTPCKAIGRIFVDAIDPEKTKNHPYTLDNNPQSPPPWWPEGVSHDTPAHLSNEGKSS